MRIVRAMFGILLMSYSPLASSEPQTEPDRPSKPSLVLLGKVELHPEKSTHIHPSYSGIISKTYKSIGDPVRRGDALASLESNVGIQSHIMRSSINGVVLEKNITEGQPVSEDMEAFVIADLSIVQVGLVAYPRDLPLLKKGTKIYFEKAPNLPIQETTISFISPIIDEATGTTRIFVNLSNESGFWRPGQYIMGNVR